MVPRPRRIVCAALVVTAASCSAAPATRDAPDGWSSGGADAGFPSDASRPEAPGEPTHDAAPDAGARDGSPPDGDAATAGGACSHYSALRQPFFGDLHIHTALSLDANVQGTRVRPADAYRFARGEPLALPPYDAAGKPQRTLSLSRPLDFAAVTDHAEFLGLVQTCTAPALPGYDSIPCSAFRALPGLSFYDFNLALTAQPADARYPEPCSAQNQFCGAGAATLWAEIQSAAAAAQDTSAACSFTSFVAYEWSASPGGQNLHRNVIFAGSEVPALPFSYFDGSREDDLWDALDRDCLAGGRCDVLTIPHNSNLSAGLMFEPVTRAGAAIDAAYAKRRRSFEPLAEIIQHKGASECLPGMGNDEACNFELLRYNTLVSVALALAPDTLVPRDSLRDALGAGLAFEAELGESPFAFGFVGSTDSHVGAAGAVEETTFPGHGGAGNSSATDGLVDQVFLNPGGLAVLWAEENTRASLFAAMRRREAYATSGPRDTVRMFAGYDVPEGACERPDLVEGGYAGGVPMGGELTARAGAPRIVLSALADGAQRADVTGLAKLQVIKGTLVDGKPVFEVLEVASAPGPQGVDLDTCTPTGTAAPALCGELVDPGFDPRVPTFYYGRVLHAPSCRWQALACRAAAVRCDAAVPSGYEGCCAGEPETVEERAWTSPIFVHASP